MRMHAAPILAALTVLVGGMGMVSAQEQVAPAYRHGDGFGHRMHGHMMREVDLNGDGSVSLAEAEAMRTVQFLSMVLDGDDALTETEMVEAARRRIGERVAKRFARMDANGDGRIDRAEYDSWSSARFAAADTDGDGRITRDEMRERMHGWRHGRGGDGKQPED